MPPDYLIDGLMLRKNVYSMTGRTGDGKTAVALRFAAHVSAGLSIGGMNVEKGRVVFFAGENPDDVRTRWVKLCEEMKLDPDAMNVFFLVGTPPISKDEIRYLIEADVAVCGPVTLVIVDTSAAYYSGDDENDNKQMGEHARMLRSFVNLSGNPTVLTTCHPTKNPDMTNLLPRGGGAFIAEMDGNLVAIRERGSMLVVIDTHGKFRGPEFAPFAFKLVEGTSERLKDSKGRLIWTVFAVPVSDAERVVMEDAGDRKQIELLRSHGRASSQLHVRVSRGPGLVLQERQPQHEPRVPTAVGAGEGQAGEEEGQSLRHHHQGQGGPVRGRSRPPIQTSCDPLKKGKIM